MEDGKNRRKAFKVCREGRREHDDIGRDPTLPFNTLLPTALESPSEYARDAIATAAKARQIAHRHLSGSQARRSLFMIAIIVMYSSLPATSYSFGLLHGVWAYRKNCSPSTLALTALSDSSVMSLVKQLQPMLPRCPRHLILSTWLVSSHNMWPLSRKPRVGTFAAGGYVTVP